MWSLPTLGPCVISLLKIPSSLLPSTMSGLPFLFPLWKVWKSGPRKSKLYSLQMWYSSSPLCFIFLNGKPKNGWIALKSPAISTGALVDMSFWKSREFILSCQCLAGTSWKNLSYNQTDDGCHSLLWPEAKPLGGLREGIRGQRTPHLSVSKGHNTWKITKPGHPNHVTYHTIKSILLSPNASRYSIQIIFFLAEELSYLINFCLLSGIFLYDMLIFNLFTITIYVGQQNL